MYMDKAFVKEVKILYRFLGLTKNFCTFLSAAVIQRCAETFLSSQETFFCRKLKNGRMSFLDQCNVETASLPDL